MFVELINKLDKHFSGVSFSSQTLIQSLQWWKRSLFSPTLPLISIFTNCPFPAGKVLCQNPRGSTLVRTKFLSQAENLPSSLGRGVRHPESPLLSGLGPVEEQMKPCVESSSSLTFRKLHSLSKEKWEVRQRKRESIWLNRKKRKKKKKRSQRDVKKVMIITRVFFFCLFGWLVGFRPLRGAGIILNLWDIDFYLNHPSLPNSKTAQPQGGFKLPQRDALLFQVVPRNL